MSTLFSTGASPRDFRYALLKKLKKQIYDLEKEMTEEQLTQRQARQMRSMRHGIKKKIKYAKTALEKKNLHKKLLDINLRIEEKEQELGRLKQKNTVTKISVRQKNIRKKSVKVLEAKKIKHSNDLNNELNEKLKKLLIENIGYKFDLLKILLAEDSNHKTA